ncbi:MAG: NAD(P)/FAD-dependent oxidoreductase [Proteobacteria bacterium]|nr:NAD(P)/FAD-dependent oxidoreductase [Pseudomonadota bacterium]MBU1688234.1 NAD(P)/FAD-dependent oxidoreductase [Pseudomonadota bacterium]
MTTNPTFHTIIIGAGPAGLACATLLAQAGQKVLILERKNEIGPKICAGGLTRSGLAARIPTQLVERTFNSQEVITPHQHCTLKADRPMIVTVDRRALGQFMLHSALAQGVQVDTGVQVVKIAEGQVITRTREYSFDYLVGADGSSSLVRRFLGLPTTDIGMGINLFVPGSFNRMEWHFDHRLFRNGYAWIFPHAKTASIGVYASDRSIPPRQLLKNLHQWAVKHGMNLYDHHVQAARINYDYRGWQFGRYFLIGDAAGLASPLTGEGILPAIISGEEVAARILNPDYDCPLLHDLIHRHRRHRTLVTMTAGNKVTAILVSEAMVLALKLGLIDFTSLEMTGHQTTR